MGLNRKPDLVRLKRWRRAMPQYNLGHAELVKRIETQARSLPGIALAGAAYGGIGIPDCIRSGRQAARDLASHLG
jgi:oxygen-dependent protoporphyrinogen oxidase